MLDDIAKQLEIVCDYKTTTIAAKNVLQAMLSNVFSFKNVQFKSYRNLNKFACVSYYAFNFVTSGGYKDKLLDEIKDNLFPFYEEYIDKFNDERLAKIEDELDTKMISEIESPKQKNEAEQEIKLKKKQFQIFNAKVTSATQAKMYELLKIIKEEKKGSLCMENTEFGTYFSEAHINKDSTKKQILDMLFNLWDGKFGASDTVQTNRRNLSGVPFSGIFMSSPNSILNNVKLFSHFLTFLGDGMARRSFIYFKPKENFRVKGKLPTISEKEKAYKKLEEYKNRIENIFNSLDNREFIFTVEANERIREHNEWVDDEVEKLTKLNSYTDEKTEILVINLDGSGWKIIKLAVICHILRDPSSSLITVEDFEKAFEFFKETHECLRKMLFADRIGDVDKLFNFLLQNINKWQSRGVLRNQNFVQSSYFKNWFDFEVMPDLEKIVQEKGLALVHRSSGTHNNGTETVLYDPSKYEFIEGLRECRNDKVIVKGELVEKSKTGGVRSKVIPMG